MSALRVARRVIWFEEPERALADPIQFLAHVMVFDTVEDLKALQGIVGKDEYRQVPEQAPPGIFDARSWPIGIWFAAAIPRHPCRCGGWTSAGLASGPVDVGGVKKGEFEGDGATEEVVAQLRL